MGTGFYEANGLTLSPHGAQRFPSAVSTAALQRIENAVAYLPPDKAGTRLHGIAALRPLLAPTGPVGAVAARVLGEACQPVRAILFDKTPATNWSLAWHQDRTIAVAERIDVGDFEKAEDIVQEAFVAAWLALPTPFSPLP
jgi:hypothetical protein